MGFPRLYAIVDAEVLRTRNLVLRDFAEQLAQGGVRLVQYRNKTGSPQNMLRDAVEIREAFEDTGTMLVFNDRADLAVLAGFDGVHVGQEDSAPEDARKVVGRERIVGVSTHSLAQVRAAELSCADYVAFGPVFATGTKADAAAVVGLDGLRAARQATGKPLVAIGGITRGNARSVLDAGADVVAVISALIEDGKEPGKVAGDFSMHLR